MNSYGSMGDTLRRSARYCGADVEYAPGYGAHAFRLTAPQLYTLVDYIRHWDVLRQCCGAQMSKDWRATLQGHGARTPDPLVHSSKYAACEAYNLDVVEAMLVSTEVFRRFGAHGQWIKKLSTHDGDLNGTYCSWANNEIARHNLQFNDNPASVRQRQIIKKSRERRR